jgi:hypothetical protein
MVVNALDRSDYRRYPSVFRHFMRKAGIHQLVENAGKQGFTNWLKQITI